MAPAVGETPEGVNTTAFGKLKFARFSKLNISARNCRFRRSLMRVSFNVEKSQVARPGPDNRVAAHVAVKPSVGRSI